MTAPESGGGREKVEFSLLEKTLYNTYPPPVAFRALSFAVSYRSTHRWAFPFHQLQHGLRHRKNLAGLCCILPKRSGPFLSSFHARCGLSSPFLHATSPIRAQVSFLWLHLHELVLSTVWIRIHTPELHQPLPDILGCPPPNRRLAIAGD